MNRFFRSFKLDWYIIVPSSYLAFIGYLVLSAIASKETGVAIDLEPLTQIVALLLGFVCAMLIATFKITKSRKLAKAVYLVSISMLLIVILNGVTSNGSTRWLDFGVFQLQPTEIAKIGLVLMLAYIFDEADASVNKIKTIIRTFVIAAIPAGMIVIQPDLGSALILFVIWITTLFVSRFKLSRFALIVLVILGSVVIAVPFLAEYQQQRLISYFNPSEDTSGAGYNVLQANIAIGSGGLYGSGIDSGSQSQLNFLPSQHTDFVFAVTAEKLGLVGAMSVIVAFMSLLLRISYLAWLTDDQSERSILVGVVAILFSHIAINIGMNLGLMPVTGLPLPLLSYGGTFAFTSSLLIGFCVIISKNIRSRLSSIKQIID